MEATGWQKHTVRGFVTAAMRAGKKKPIRVTRIILAPQRTETIHNPADEGREPLLRSP